MSSRGAAATSATAPHLRDGTSVPSLLRVVVVALLPCVLVGAWNTGRQACSALPLLEPGAEAGWRVECLRRLGLDLQPEGVVACFALGLLYLLPLLVAAAVATLGWERVFARLRHRPVGEGAFVTALVFTLLLPPATPVWQAAMGASFGIVLGKLVFGGIGRNFLNPAVVGLAYLAVAHAGVQAGGELFPGLAGYSGTDVFARAAEGGAAALRETGLSWGSAFLGDEPGRLGETSVLACLVGAAYLLLRRAASWRVMLAVVVGAALAAAGWNVLHGDPGPAAGLLPWHGHLWLGGLAFTAVFVATDPVSGAATPAGRWVFGLLLGVLVVSLRLGSPRHPDGVVAAVLLANVAAPLIDHAVVSWRLRRRTRPGGARHD